MRVNEVQGYLLEVMDPAYAMGVLVAWVSSAPPDRRILGTGRGNTPAAACHAAVEDWLSRPPDRLTTREERIGKQLQAELIQS